MGADYGRYSREALVATCGRLESELAEANRLRAQAEAHAAVLKVELSTERARRAGDVEALRGKVVPEWDPDGGSICPRCYWPLAEERQNYCSNCGSSVEWDAPDEEPDIDVWRDR